MISEAAHAECVRLLELLTNKRVQESWSWVFMTPVDIPGYRDVIKKPMDLGTVKKNLGSKPSRCRFKSHEKFARDVRLVFNNALLYNKDDHNVKGSVYDAAQHLLRVFETAYTKSIETVLRADDAATERKKQQEKEGVRGESSKEASGGSARPAAGMAATAVAAAPSAGGDSHHHSDHHHRHRHHGEGDESSKHKKDKSSKKDKSKKEKKSKKSKKKSKERDDEKDREHKHRHHSSSESKKKLVRRDSDASTASSEGGVTSAVTDKVAAPSRIEATSSREDVRVYHEVPRQPTPKSSSVAPTAVVSAGEKMSEEELTACQAVLMKLIKYKEGNVSPAAPFLQPVDLTHFPDYRVKVPNRMHLYGVQRKLRSGSYPNKDAFAYDVRLIFANCLVYNSDVVLTKVMRSHAVTLMKLFEAQFAKIGGTWPGIPERWKCHYIIDELLAHRTDGQETAQWFKYPIETYYNSPDQIPYGYYKKVKVPMDLGTVSSRLHLGEYKRASEFIDGLQLVFDNCIKYWKSDPYGQTYCDSAEALIKLLHAQAARLLNGSSSGAADAEDKRVSSSSSRAQSGPASVVSKSSSSSGDREKTKKKSSKSSSLRDSASGSAFPHKDICMSILKLLRAHKMKGYRGIEIPTAGPFLHAVDTTKYPDYLTIISEPMDFAKIERKLKSDRYVSVSEFSADVHLIFSNCHKYNSDPVEGADIRAMASNLRDYFVMLYNEKLGHLDGTFEQRPVPVKSESSLSSLAVKPSSGLAEPSKERAASSITKIDTAAPSAAKISTSSDRLSTPNVLPARDRDSEKPVTVKPSRVVETPVKREAAVSNPIPSSTAKIESKVGVPAHGTTVSTATSLHTQVHSNTDELSVKKEKKEKKEKKKKDKKEKKEKKKKKEKRHDKHEKKHDKHEKKRDKTSSVDAGATTSAISSQPSSTLQTPSAPASAGSAAAPSNPTPRSVGSKVSSADASNAAASSSKKSSKKSKKTDLKSWEATCERILNRLAKIEQVSKLHFDKPLVEVFPQLTAEYTRLIPDPMDLRTLREQLHRHELTQDEFVRKGRVIFENAVKFNCAEDPASMHVREMSTHLLWYFDSLCVEHHLSPLSAKGLNRAQLRQERAELVTNIPMEIKAKECQKLLRVLNSQKYDKNCWPFRKPVRVLFPTLPPEYFDVIKTPMDLTTIGEKLATFEYKTHGDFIADVRLTFENAMVYNHADKDREGWNVYAAAVHMLAVVEDLLGDMTLEVNERIRRRELTRKERERLGEKKVKSDHHHSSSQKEDTPKKAPKTSKVSDTVIKLPKPSGDVSSRPPLPPASSTSATAGSDAGVNDPSATRIKLSLVNRPNLERMNKSERKAEEKRRKRARREEEIARSEKRRRTAVAATDDALREAEARSRRRLQKLEMAQAMRAREERERQVKEEAEARALAEKRKFDASSWSGVLTPAQAASTGFWARKRVKLQVPTVFQTMINA